MAHLKEKKPANFTTKEKAALKQPCSCGSGKKYKVCCYGKTPAAIQAERAPITPPPARQQGYQPPPAPNGKQQPPDSFQPAKQAGSHRHRV